MKTSDRLGNLAAALALIFYGRSPQVLGVNDEIHNKPAAVNTVDLRIGDIKLAGSVIPGTSCYMELTDVTQPVSSQPGMSIGGREGDKYGPPHPLAACAAVMFEGFTRGINSITNSSAETSVHGHIGSVSIEGNFNPADPNCSLKEIDNNIQSLENPIRAASQNCETQLPSMLADGAQRLFAIR